MNAEIGLKFQKVDSPVFLFVNDGTTAPREVQCCNQPSIRNGMW